VSDMEEICFSSMDAELLPSLERVFSKIRIPSLYVKCVD
jgi:ABC-type molybdate transport system ATPase subunit